jgi:RHS repeat-associated protein
MTDNRNNTDIAALDMLNDAAVIHTVVWDPTEPAATRPLLLTVPNPANPEILAEYYTFGFDQAKNVTELFDSSGNIAAAYDHGPFGEDMASTGPAAALNPFRFSSEAWDSTLGLVQYTFRPLNPLDGRFISRDPIGEQGGLNLYGFVGNDPVNRTDYLGYCECGVSGFKMTNRGWTKNHDGYTFTFTIEYKYLTGGKYRSSCCRYVQWIQSTMMLNGSPINHSQGGTPLDNKLHVDASPNYAGDDIMQSGATWSNESPTPDRFKTTDMPGFHGLRDGDVFLDSNVFAGRVYDTCNDNKIVAQQSFRMKVSGTWPAPKYSP